MTLPVLSNLEGQLSRFNLAESEGPARVKIIVSQQH